MNGRESWEKETKWNRRYYEKRYEEFGATVRALDWGSEESQQLRFKVLSEVTDLSDKSLLDVGCGLGDFYGWLRGHEFHHGYTGIDLSSNFIEEARDRFPSGTFLQGGFPGKVPEGRYDVIVASGIFTYRPKSGIPYFRMMVEEMFHRCTEAVAFNVLSAWAQGKEEDEFHADPLDTLSFCRTLSPWVSLRHDYHPRDFTIYLYKEKSP